MPVEAPPAPTPAAPPAAPAPSPAAAKPAAGTKPFNPALDNPAIEEHFKSYDKPKGPQKDEPKKDAPKPSDKPADQAQDAKADVKPDAKIEPDKTAPVPEPEHKNIKELRTAYETTKKAAQAHEAKIKELEARLSETAKTQPVADEKVWQEKIAAKDKEYQAIQAKLAEADFTQSQEYQEKYWKPYVNTWTRATAAIQGFQAQNADGTARQITKEDAELLLSLPEAKAFEVAKEIFGEGNPAITVMAAYKIRVNEALEAVNEGKAQFQKISEERRNREFQERQALDDARSKLWVKENQAFTESSPWFKEDENDPEGTEALKKGYAEIDRVFSEEFNKGKIEDIVKAHVALRHKAAVYDRLDSEVKKLREKVSALEKERAELMDSAPKGDGTTPKAPDSDANLTPSQLLDKLPWGKRR